MNCPSLYEYLRTNIHEDDQDTTFIGTQSELPQEVYEQIPENIRRKVVTPNFRDTNQKWKTRPEGFVTYE